MPDSSDRCVHEVVSKARTTPFKEKAKEEVYDLYRRADKCRELGITRVRIAHVTGLTYMTVHRLFNVELRGRELPYETMRVMDLYLKSINL